MSRTQTTFRNVLSAVHVCVRCPQKPMMFFFLDPQVLEDGQTCDGVAQKDRGVCRMDIIDSQMSYMGYDATESYGVTWKVGKRVFA